MEALCSGPKGGPKELSTGGYAGRDMMDLNPAQRKMVLESLRVAEEVLQRAPMLCEAFVTSVVKLGNKDLLNTFNGHLQNLYREDLFFADKNFNYWSLTRHEDNDIHQKFELFSERFQRIFPDYMLSQDMLVVAKPETRVVNLDLLLNVLNSHDANLLDEYRWLFDGQARFLDQSTNKRNKIGLISYPRSGNTFLRKQMELLTGVETGSDNYLHWNIILQMQGLKGEYTADDSVFVVKSHFPWVMTPSIQANKLLVIVRNPFDILVSWITLISFGSHSMKCPFVFATEYPEWWNWMVCNLVEQMKTWFKVIMQSARLFRVPVLFIRYEDLASDSEPVLDQLLRFLLNRDSIEGTNAERRMKEVIAASKEKTVLYNLKDTTLKFNSNKDLYTKEQIEFIWTHLKEMLYFFGYVESVTGDEPNPTGFISEPQEADSDLRKTAFGFRDSNQKHLGWVASLCPEDFEQIQFDLEDYSCNIPVLQDHIFDRIQLAIQDYKEKEMFGESSINLK